MTPSRRAFLLGRSTATSGEDAPIPHVVEVTERCLTRRQVVCRSCGEVCEAGAIHFPPRLGGVARPVVAVDRCTDCGDCLRDCPAQAMQRIARPAASHPSALQGAA